MREIKFRGKREDNGEWVTGFYVKHETRQTCVIGDDKLSPDEIKHLIVVDSFADWNMPRILQGIEVIPETVGQFTGLKDKNGNGVIQVYEHDIITIEGKIRGNIYENEPRKTDIVIPPIGTSSWETTYKKAVERGFDYAE